MNERTYSHRPLLGEQAWLGLWVRNVAGPTRRGVTMTYSPWHYVARLVPPNGVEVGVLEGIGSARRCRVQWPAGGSRLEVASTLSGPPEVGPACHLCTGRLNLVSSQQLGRIHESVTIGIGEVDGYLAQLVPGYVAQELEQLLPRVVRALLEALAEEDGA